MCFRVGFCLVLCSLSLTAEVAAQDSLASMRESWAKCNQAMTEKFAALDSGDVTPGLADEYRDLVDEANDLIKAMRTQGLAELKEKPSDGQVIRSLLAIMVHDAQSGRDSMVLNVGQALVDARINPKYFEQAAKVDQLEPSQKHVFEELVYRHNEAVTNDLPRVKMTTTSGEFVLELFENEAPNTVRNFVSLVESGFYSDKLFHRVIEDFMAQGGGFEIEGIGSGGPGYQIECECKVPDARRNFTGTISMALSETGRDTGGSQFFINLKHNEGLDRKHTVFGRIISGTDVLDKIERTEVSRNGSDIPIKQARPDKIVSAEVVRKRDHSYRVRKKGEPELPEEPTKKEEVKAETSEPADDESDEPMLEPADKEDTDSKMKEDAKEAEAESKSEADSDSDKDKDAKSDEDDDDKS